MVCAVPLCELIDRARLQPRPAPAAAATTAARTRVAAGRWPNRLTGRRGRAGGTGGGGGAGGAGGGGGAHEGTGPAYDSAPAGGTSDASRAGLPGSVGWGSI